MSDRLALANAIEDAGIERAKAERVASVIFDAIHDNVATKADVQASEAAIRGELRAETAAIRGELAQTRTELKADIAASQAAVRALLSSETARLDTRIERLDATVKAQPNAIMLRLGTLMVVLTGIILAALRYWPPGHG
jgi:3-oxoacyl-ACP reductase-like protein